MNLPKPGADTDIEALAAQLDAASHEDRVRWIRTLREGDQKRLFALAEGRRVTPASMVGEPGEVVRHVGQNGLPLFNRFEKRFAQVDGEFVGYNANPWPVKAITGPGHFLVYTSPLVPDEVWMDYRRLPTVHHPDFPPFRSNEQGLAALVFGNSVDVLRRVSKHVTIGDVFKTMPREEQAPGLIELGPTSWLARIGSRLPTTPFVLCRVPR